ncbi:MAG TPA: hypothetical protein VFS67_01775 [Polyangiaceae bacterium]|nr:hypothetical protein [Polyangiaceae bacterium]
MAKRGRACDAGGHWSLTPLARLRTGALCLSTLALGACGGDDSGREGRPIEGCEQFSYSACDIRDAKCQNDLFQLVGCLRGEDLASAGPPPVSLLSEAEATAMVLQDSDPPAATAEADFSAQVRGLELLGLVDPGLIASQSDVIDVTIEAVAAFYQPSTRSVVIIDRGDPLDDSDADAVLAHEFVHAWQDRRHDLNSFGDEPDLDSDRSLALTSVVEGEAMVYQLLLMLAYRGVNLKQANYTGMWQSLVIQGEQLASAEGSPMVTAPGIFPYTYGTRYMGEHWLDGSHEELDAIFERPPASSLEVMLDSSGASLPEIETFDVMPAPLDGYRYVVDDVAGAWVVLSRMLDLMGSLYADSLRELATHWRGDRFWVYQTEDDQRDTAVVWWMDWSDPISAVRAAEMIASAARPAAAQVEVQGSRLRVVVSERGPDLLRWVQRAADGAR